MKQRTTAEIKIEIAKTERIQKDAECRYAKNEDKLANLYIELEAYEGRDTKAKWDKVMMAVAAVVEQLNREEKR